jgi:hypothetical protein
VVEDKYVGFGEVVDLCLIDVEAIVIRVIKFVEEVGEVTTVASLTTRGLSRRCFLAQQCLQGACKLQATVT